MPGKASLQMIGNWDKKVGVALKDALAVSMDVMGRTGEEACKHAIILMAQSARALTKQAKQRRKVQRDKHGRYVEIIGKTGIRKFYEWAADNFENARTIRNRGLAKRSWMWGLDALGAKKVSKPIPGAGSVHTITSETVNGYIKENALSYIGETVPAGWESIVQMKAGNKIMAQARKKMERRWQSEVRRKQRRVEQSVSRFFVKALGSI